MHSFLWLSNIPLHICLRTYPFICWWISRLPPCPSYCKQCCNEQWCACVFFKDGFLEVYAHSGIKGLYGEDEINILLVCVSAKHIHASLAAQLIKNSHAKQESAAMQETRVQFLDQEHPWRRKWQPTPVFLPGKSHGQRSLVGYSPCNCKSQTWLSN